MTTPNQSPTNEHPDLDQTRNSNDSEDDIWASSPPCSPTQNPTSSTGPSQSTPSFSTPAEPLLSDLPTVRRRRMADGYRDGLSHSKAQVMQGGFDEGYPIGVQMALRVGKVLGVLEGVLGGLRKAAEVGDEDERGRRKKGVEEVERSLKEAREELGRGRLLDGVGEEVVMSEGGVLGAVEGDLRKWEERIALDRWEVQGKSGLVGT